MIADWFTLNNRVKLNNLITDFNENSTEQRKGCDNSFKLDFMFLKSIYAFWNIITVEYNRNHILVCRVGKYVIYR